MQIYIYCSYWGAYTAAVAAGLHLNKIPAHGAPTKEALYDLPFFDSITPLDHGQLKFCGSDARGNKVYILATRKAFPVIKKAYTGLRKIFGPSEQINIINVDPAGCLALRLGAYFSRRWGEQKLAQPLILWGIKKSFPHLVEIARESGKDYG